MEFLLKTMKYLGGKVRHSKEIIKNILQDIRDLDISKYTWIEPFVGAGSVVEKVGGLGFKNIFANDINHHLIELFKALQNRWIPPENITEEQYKLYKSKAKSVACSDSPMIAFVGIGSSFGGKWFGGFARGKSNKGISRNYAKESAQSLLRQIPLIKNVQFISQSYLSLAIPNKSIIYCDPPYQNTTAYDFSNNFNHKIFWDWCDEQVKNGNKVYVSEYSAPENWISIWEKPVSTCIDSAKKLNSTKKATEKLFTFKT